MYLSHSHLSVPVVEARVSGGNCARPSEMHYMAVSAHSGTVDACMLTQTRSREDEAMGIPGIVTAKFWERRQL